MPPNNKEDLIEYRLEQVEAKMESLDTVKEILCRWDTKFSNVDFMQLPLQTEKINVIAKDVETLKTEVNELNKYKWKLIAWLTVVGVIFQTFVLPMVSDFLKGAVNRPITSETQ